jgi:hypothetical protein
MSEIEHWEFEIQHIKGTDNTLADILSCNPPHYNTPNTTNLRQRDQIIQHATDLNIDNSVKRGLKNLAILQNTDPRLRAIKGGLTTHFTTGTKFLVNNDVLYCKGDKEPKLEGYVAGISRTKGYEVCSHILGACYAELYVQVSVNRDNLRINNQQDASSIQNFILSRNSTCFRAPSVPIIRNYQLYT